MKTKEPWKNRIVESGERAAGEFLANPKNWRVHPKAQREALTGVLSEVGWVQSVIVNRTTGNVVDGHARIEEALKLGDETPVPFVEVELTEAEEAKILATIDPISAMAGADKSALDSLLREVETSSAAVGEMLAELAESNGLEYGAGAAADNADTEPQIDRAEELRAKWQTETGQLWRIGEHRLLCGDSTRREDVERVMGGERAELLHADPPYGMGKEKDGVENDNLYREKLDAFQMQWWRAFRPSLLDNGSAYVWGNADDLWRLWYVGGLRDSERLTFRNEIVWDKSHAQGMSSESHRQYPTASERCLFFMLGEQGFNNNADNYWEGWDSIVDYLESNRKQAGFSIKDTKRIAGHSENSGCHWFDKSQWSMPTKDVYDSWKIAAKGKAFKREYDELKREYDELKREFYSTRATFDNTHDNMTDVWRFERVKGDERNEHATPKPVAMICRAVKSSARDGAIVAEPFAGSGTTIVACQQLGRKCRAIEISPAYVAVILERMKTAFPLLEIVKLGT